jgi:hypothetical protein
MLRDRRRNVAARDWRIGAPSPLAHGVGSGHGDWLVHVLALHADAQRVGVHVRSRAPVPTADRGDWLTAIPRGDRAVTVPPHDSTLVHCLI